MKKLISAVFVLALAFGSLTACTFDSTTSASAGGWSNTTGGGFGSGSGAASGGLRDTEDFVDDTVGGAYQSTGLPSDPVGPIQNSAPAHSGASDHH